MDASIAQYGEFMLSGGNIDKNSVSFFGFLHAQIMKDFRCPAHGIFTCFGFDMNPNLTGGSPLCLLNSLHNGIFVSRRE